MGAKLAEMSETTAPLAQSAAAEAMKKTKT
jgi:hypothetical protein